MKVKIRTNSTKNETKYATKTEECQTKEMHVNKFAKTNARMQKTEQFQNKKNMHQQKHLETHNENEKMTDR